MNNKYNILIDMEILSWHDFELKSNNNGNKNQKVYKGKILHKGPIFSLLNKDSAVRYCQDFQESLCLIVENKNYFQLWEENVESSEKVTEKLVENEKKEVIQQLPITDELVAQINLKLSEYIGPIAKILSKKVLAQNPDLTPQELINLLSMKIPSYEESLEFKNNFIDWF